MAEKQETSWGGTGHGLDITLPVVIDAGEGCPDGTIPLADINTEADGSPVVKS